MSLVRLRRLQADFAKLNAYVDRQSRVQLVQADGNPPDRYQLEYRIEGLRRVNDDIKVVDNHLVEILLPASYPRLPPQCRMLTPIFHPNIAPHAICIGDHWSAGEPLVALVVRIGEMISYQSYNTKSPLNGEAARWVTDNQDRLPLDSTSLLVETDEVAAGPATSRGAGVGQVGTPPPSLAPAAGSAPAPDATLMLVCPECKKTLRVSARAAGKRSRCPSCQTVFQVPE